MNHRFLHSILPTLACALIALTGCQADVDLNNIDPSAKVDMGLSLPLGEISLKLGDLFAPSDSSQITIDEDGTYRFSGNLSFEHDFVTIDLSKYNAEADKEILMKNYLPTGTIGGYIPVSTTIDIPTRFAFNNINTDPDNQRVDSICLSAAQLNITLSQNFGLNISQISSLTIDLPDHIRRAAGQTIVLPLSGAAFGKTITTELGACTFILMDDPNAAPGKTNMQDTMEMALHLGLQVNAGETITIDDQSKLQVHVSASVEDYKAVYGYVSENNAVSVDSTIVLSSFMNIASAFRKLQVSIAEPSFGFNLSTNLGLPMKFTIKHLYSQNADRSKTQKVTFNGQESYTEHLLNFVRVNDPLDKMASNTILFNQDNSTIGSLLSSSPEYVYYAFSISADSRAGINQHRVTKDTRIAGDVNISIPFKFNEGTNIELADTVDTDFSKLDIDSLARQVEMIDSIDINSLKLVLTAQSYIPWDVTADYVFLDANGKDLKISASEGNSIKVAGPTQYNASGVATEPGKSYVTIAVDDETLRQLKQVRHIALVLHLEDVDLSALADKNVVFPLSLNKNTGISVKAALSANVAAYLQLAFSNDK